MRASPKSWCRVVLVVSAIAAQDFAAKAEEAAQRVPPPAPGLVLLTPGTQVTGPTNLPAGWTHLVIKSVPRLASGDLASLPDLARTTATLFRTVMLAEVRPSKEGGAPFTLRRLGIGLCTPVKGVDTVVSSATLDTLHVPLGWIDRIVLKKAEDELLRGRLKARTSTFALYSSPTLRKEESGHEPVVLRYAVLVGSQTGSLQTLLWSQPSDVARRKAPEEMVLLPPGLVNNTAVDVLAERVFSAVAVNWSFALGALPSGKPVGTTPAVRRWCLQDSLATADVKGFEQDLRMLVDGAGKNP